MSKIWQLRALLAVGLALAPAGAAVAAPSSASATAAAHDAALAAAAGSLAGHATFRGFGHFGFGFYGHHFRFGHHGHFGHYGYHYGYHPYGYYGYGYHRPYGYHGYGYYPYRYGGYQGRYGAIDLKVKPSKAEVYVDGRYVGPADRFDGFPSFLWLEEGVHKLVFYKDGYQTEMREISVQPDHTVDLRARLVEGTATPPEELVAPPADEKAAAPGYGENAGDGPGRLMISVAPDDAVIYIDGHFFGVADELGHVRSGVPIEAGEHTVEIVRPGYRSVERTIRVGAGETVTLDATLRPR